jgi:hypothetical protein
MAESWIGDSVQEFKKLPTWGKIGIGAAVVGVAAFGYIQWKQSQASGTNVAGSLVPGGSPSTSGGASGGSQSPYSSTTSNGNTVPILPFGVTPIYDGAGNLIGFQQGPASTGGSNTGGSNGGSNGGSTGGSNGGSTGSSSIITDPFNVYPAQNAYTNSQGQTVYNPIMPSEAGKALVASADKTTGYIAPTTAAPKGTVIVAPGANSANSEYLSAWVGYDNSPQQLGRGGGGMSLASLIHMPKLTTHTVLPGETFAKLVHQLGVDWQSLYERNGGSTRLTPGTKLDLTGLR